MAPPAPGDSSRRTATRSGSSPSAEYERLELFGPPATPAASPPLSSTTTSTAGTTAPPSTSSPAEAHSSASRRPTPADASRLARPSNDPPADSPGRRRWPALARRRRTVFEILTGPRRVTADIDLAHTYGTSTVHRVRDGRPGCGRRPLTRLDEPKAAGDYIPARWDRWRLCPDRGCFHPADLAATEAATAARQEDPS